MGLVDHRQATQGLRRRWMVLFGWGWEVEKRDPLFLVGVFGSKLRVVGFVIVLSHGT